MKMRFRKRCALPLVLIAWLTGCTINPVLTDLDRQYYVQRTTTPSTCLAFSGGGVRSTSVAIGVLRELHHAGKLESIDLVSGTSGGSWALLWMYRHASKGSVANVFGTPEKMSKALEHIHSTPVLDALSRAWMGLWGPARLARSALYGDLSTAIGPSSFLASYTGPNGVLKTAQRERLPVPIVTVTGLHKACAVDGLSPRLSRAEIDSLDIAEKAAQFMPMGRHVIEIDPMSWGNAHYGFSDQFPHDLGSMEYWAMSSGAFIDYPYYQGCPLLQALGLSWGDHVDLQVQSRQVPLFLVDGGFADNLAAFPLLRRGCNRTIIIDAEEDPDFAFDGYQRLRAGVFELKGQLSVPVIDSWLSQYPAGRTSAAVDPAVDIVRFPALLGVFRTYEAEMEIVYVKLSVDPAHLERYSPATRAAYGTADFPHTRTEKTAYTKEEFRAHADLGSTLTQAFLLPRMAADGGPRKDEAQ